ncbi:phosphotransferase family protein [Microlunatus sp. GCM10028923]|uniref:phosphotransferase family protein n=1 Tax=Microlunatus sp. GCM10028923 TaxID=3273400 RepID=UPI00360C122C
MTTSSVVGATTGVRLPAEAVLDWLRRSPGEPSGFTVVGQRPLTGGLSEGGIDHVRLDVTGAPAAETGLVIKRTGSNEATALRLLAPLAERSVPELIMSGEDEQGSWIVTPYYPGEPVGLVGLAPLPVFGTMARVHARYAERPDLPESLERIDAEFCRRLLTEFVPESAQQAGEVGDRAVHWAARLADDREFLTAPHGFGTTLLHGDLYGLNVLQPVPARPWPMIIDWNTARVGPPMFDVAMAGATADDDRFRTYLAAWTEAAGPVPPPTALEHAWATALINAGFAAVVARRGDPADGAGMLRTAELAYQAFRAGTTEAARR